MFSDWRSLIFGYTSNKTQEEENDANSNQEDPPTASGSLSTNEHKSNPTTGTGNGRNSKVESSSAHRSSPSATELTGSEQRQPTDRPASKQARRARKQQQAPKANKRNIVDSTATALEQTLNAATTKFTEQLLPQSTSIEQLHSSSHQLLPTLKEQHEEDEQKRIKDLASVNPPEQAPEDELDEEFEADSWELLDLIEPATSKQETGASRDQPELVEAPKQEEVQAEEEGTAVQLGTAKNVNEISVQGEIDNPIEDDDDINWDSEDEGRCARDIDASWFVTPPPCFTGSSKLLMLQKQNGAVLGTADGSSAAKPAIIDEDESSEANKQPVRENELIEHPSIYIASTSGLGRADLAQSSAQVRKKELLSEVLKKNLQCIDSAQTVRRKAERPVALKPITVTMKDISGVATVGEPKPSTSAASLASPSLAVSGCSPKRTKKVKKSLPAKTAGSVVSPAEQKQKEAWSNKFVVSNWADDEQDDVDDFDNLFDDHQFPALCSANETANCTSVVKSKCWPKKPVPVDVPVSPSPDALSDFSSEDIAITWSSRHSALSDEQPTDKPADRTAACLENLEPAAEDLSGAATTGSDVKVPQNHIVPATVAAAPSRPVRPIEPERKPGWQLKRQRSKRRPLASVNSSVGSSSESTVGRKCSGRKRRATATGNNVTSDASDRCESGGRPVEEPRTFLDKISLCVAENFSNFRQTTCSGLLSGFEESTGAATRDGGKGGAGGSQMGLSQAQQSQQQQQRLGCGAQSTVSAASAEIAARASESLVARKRLAKSAMSRQNATANRSSSNGGRPSRRLKMFTHPNGCSVNRKVQSNWH